MVIRTIRLNNQIKTKREEIEAFDSRLEEINARSEELIGSVDEAENDDDLALLEEEERNLAAEKEEIEEKKSKLEGEIAALESELEELNSKSPIKESSSREAKPNNNPKGEIRMGKFKFFRDMDRTQVEEMIQREEVESFITSTRELMTQKRAVTGAELTIPVVMLDILRDNIHLYSKLISKVNTRPVKGIARQNIAGAIPEGIWTEACGKLNELSIVFNQIQVDGYKVGGFIAICNATLKDSDANLADEIMHSLSQAIGLALDKAILYGTGTKMPVGIVTRLAEVAEPAYYGDNERTWTDLHSTHLVVVTGATPEAFYADLISKLGVVASAYSDGELFWAMSSKTYRILQAKMLTVSASGAIVSGQTKTMPVIGGDIVELDFIPDNVIIGGYGSLYMLAEREGVTLAMSEHVQFIEDNTVFKGIARYDGRPVFGEAFVAVNIDQTQGAVAPVANAVTFAPDAANF